MNVKKKYGQNAELIWSDKKRYLGLPISFTHYYLIKNGEEWFKTFVKVGFFNIQIDEVNLYRMYDIALKQTLWDRIFGTGTVVIYTSDNSLPTLTLKSIKRPYEVRNMFSRLIEEQRTLHNVRVTEFQTK